MLVCGVVALIALSLPTTGQIIALVMAIALYLALIAKITIMWVRFKTGNMR
jgi:hypothetical protein